MEQLTKLLIFCLATFGMANILVFSTIFQPFREFLGKFRWKLPSKMINCILCTGFHCGWVCSLTIYSPCDQLFCGVEWFRTAFAVFFDSCLSSASSWIIFLLIRKKMEGL